MDITFVKGNINPTPIFPYLSTLHPQHCGTTGSQPSVWHTVEMCESRPHGSLRILLHAIHRIHVMPARLMKTQLNGALGLQPAGEGMVLPAEPSVQDAPHRWWTDNAISLTPFTICHLSGDRTGVEIKVNPF